MDPYNQLLSIIFESFGIDVVKTGVEDAVHLFEELIKDSMFISSALDKIHSKIMKYKSVNPKLYEDLVLCLVKCNIKLGADSAILSILNRSTKEEVLNDFADTKLFSNKLIIGYIDYLLTPENSLNNYDEKLLYKFDNSLKIHYLCDLIRTALNRINSYFPTTKETYEFIESVFYNDVSFEDAHIQKAVSFIKCYQELVMRIIYADVYELIMTIEGRPGIDQIKAYIKYILKEDKMTLDPSYGLENEAIFKCFYFLDENQRIENHKRLNDEQKETLRSINPLFMLDKSGIMSRG